MSWHLLLTDNIDQIDTQTDRLVERCNQHFKKDFAVYRPLPFVDHTGFTETVAEEIEFVIGAQEASDGACLNSHQFILRWNLAHLLQQRVVHLSGGWRKFLGVALFSNCKADAKCFIDVTSHLADERIRMLLQHLESQMIDRVVFCEYDSHLIFDMAPSRFSLLFEKGDQMVELDRFPERDKTALYSNYEHS